MSKGKRLRRRLAAAERSGEAVKAERANAERGAAAAAIPYSTATAATLSTATPRTITKATSRYRALAHADAPPGSRTMSQAYMAGKLQRDGYQAERAPDPLNVALTRSGHAALTLRTDDLEAIVAEQPALHSDAIDELIAKQPAMQSEDVRIGAAVTMAATMQPGSAGKPEQIADAFAADVERDIVEAVRESTLEVLEEMPKLRPVRGRTSVDHTVALRKEILRRVRAKLPPLDRVAMDLANTFDRIVDLLLDEVLIEAEFGELRPSIGKLRELEREHPAMLARIAEAMANARQAAARAPIPPNAKTPSNVEATAMATAYVFRPLWRLEKELGEGGHELLQRVLEREANRSPALAKLRHLGKVLFYGEPDIELAPKAVTAMLDFVELWLDSSFARLEVGHRLAAALALTDVPDTVEVGAPWKAWSLTLPDGLLDTPELGRNTTRRVWCVGAEPVALVLEQGTVLHIDDVTDAVGAYGGRLLPTIRALVRGCCLALSEPDEFRRERGASEGTSRSAKGRSGPPELEQARFVLSKPLELDLRSELTEHLSGRRRGAGGGSPKVQFLVRGHWRQQVHGPRRSLRKTIWIQPFWKGPEESRVLLRRAVVEKS